MHALTQNVAGYPLWMIGGAALAVGYLLARAVGALKRK